jgi:hypothetical protein
MVGLPASAGGGAGRGCEAARAGRAEMEDLCASGHLKMCDRDWAQNLPGNRPLGTSWNGPLFFGLRGASSAEDLRAYVKVRGEFLGDVRLALGPPAV